MAGLAEVSRPNLAQISLTGRRLLQTIIHATILHHVNHTTKDANNQGNLSSRQGYRLSGGPGSTFEQENPRIDRPFEETQEGQPFPPWFARYGSRSSDPFGLSQEKLPQALRYDHQETRSQEIRTPSLGGFFVIISVGSFLWCTF
jgi:hypothetical protein